MTHKEFNRYLETLQFITQGSYGVVNDETGELLNLDIKTEVFEWCEGHELSDDQQDKVYALLFDEIVFFYAENVSLPNIKFY